MAIDRKSGAMLAALLSVTLLAACGNAEAGSAADDSGARSGNDQAAEPQAAREANTAGTDGADDRPRRTMTESDRLSLEMAQGACRSGDFNGFFLAFAGSWAVRDKYMAGKVNFGQEGRSRAMPRQQYLDQNNFPVSPIDFYWATADSYRNFEANGDDPDKLVYVQLEFNTASDNRRRVDWTPGIFEAHVDTTGKEFGDGLGELVEQTGPGGYLLFYPTDDCWELVEDISVPR